MSLPFTLQLSQRGSLRGFKSADALMLAVAVLVGWSEHRDQLDGRALLSTFASRLPRTDHGDALTAVHEWLADSGFTPSEWEFVNDSLRFLRDEASGPIDWNAEAAYCLNPERHQGSFSLSLPLARSICRMIDLPYSGSFACLFTGSASVAWALADERDVTLFADPDVAIIVALLARAACRRLKVRRENPVDGSFLPASLTDEIGDRRSRVGHFDYIISVPPFGVRMQRGGMLDAQQVERFAPLARQSFVTLIPDGALFREAKAEAAQRAEWVTKYRVTVVSLPPGMFWPVTSISTSLLRLDAGASDGARLIDARTMVKSSTGRVQEGLIVQHLERFRSLQPEDDTRVAVVCIDQLEENGFVLLPDRYLKSGTLAALEEALTHSPVVTLGEIANIERGKAPVPLRELDEDPQLTAMEIAPADLVGGVVTPPRRQQAFDKKERSRVDGVTVRPGDILVSIKGNVGNVGLVGDDAAVAKALDAPWIISQSLAIVRLRPNQPISSPAVLNALLTAPWIREKLESMSGATTVRSLPISALRGLSIRVPTLEDGARAEQKLSEIAELREQISNHQSNLAELQERLWVQLWQMTIDNGDD